MWLGIGLAILLGTGAVTLSRAQQAGEKRVAAPMAKGELRERVLKLRTEIDLVQVDFDVARVKLSGSLEAAVGAGGDVNQTRAAIREILDTMKQETLKAGIVQLDLKGKAEALNDTLEHLGLFIPDAEHKLLEDWLAGGQESKTAADRIEQIAAKQVTHEGKAEREAIDRHQKNFSGIARKLNELKLDLAEAERQYQREVP